VIFVCFVGKKKLKLQVRNSGKLCMTKKKFITFCLMVLLAMFFSHPYVILVVECWFAEVTEIFASDDDGIKANNDEPVLEAGPSSFFAITNTVALLSALIDVQSECCVRSCGLIIDMLKANNYRSDTELFKSLLLEKELNQLDELFKPVIIRDRVAKLLSLEKNNRRLAIKEVREDIKFASMSININGIVERTYKRWGVTIRRLGPYDPIRDGLPLSSEEQVFLLVFTSHYKAILYEEVEKYLIQQAMTSGNQYSKEIEALKKIWAQEAAEKKTDH